MLSMLPTEGTLLPTAVHGPLRLFRSRATRPITSLNSAEVLSDLQMLHSSFWGTACRHCTDRHSAMLPTSRCAVAVGSVLPEAERIWWCSEGAATVAARLHSG